ncbi:MAG: chromophore lyase CpcT/CpeT [Bacteroidota bacterium]
MNQSILSVSMLSLLMFLSCKSDRFGSPTQIYKQELATLTQLMTGTFSSAEQAQEDSAFFDISLVMVPIWQHEIKARWLYVEQAVSQAKDRPYRQRVYRLSIGDAGTFESRVYALPKEERFIHAWDHPDLFRQLTPDSLMLREGCSVFLKKKEDCFAGSTDANRCSSSLRGASYATSTVEVCAENITSWDQGWNEKGEQVWGATSGGYVFKRLK